MMALDTRPYRNWVKAGLSLNILKHGVEGLVDKRVQRFQEKILQETTEEIGKPAFCNSCTTANVLPCPTDGICKPAFVEKICKSECSYHNQYYSEKTYRECPNDICNRLFKKIKANDRYGNPSWVNTDARYWCLDHRQIAACFMPKSDFNGVNNPLEPDVISILNVVCNCLYFQTNMDIDIKLTHAILKKIEQTRHNHNLSNTLELTDTALASHIDDIVTLLREISSILTDQEVLTVIPQMVELKDWEHPVSIRNEIAANKLALDYIEQLKPDKKDDIHSLFCSMNTDDVLTIMEKIERLLQTIEDGFVATPNPTTTKESLINKSNTEVLDLKDIPDLRNEMEKIKFKIEECKEEKIKQRITYLLRKQELQKSLMTIYESHLLTIPVHPLIQAGVDDMFVELALDEELSSEPDSFEKRSEDRKFRCYYDILYRKNEKCKNIYILGDAGLGKTTWCMKLLSTWISACKKMTNETIRRESFSEDEKTMSGFDVVLLVSLRHATSHFEILEFIRHQLFFEYTHMIETTKEVLEFEPHRCLIILDGLDEWTPPEKCVPERSPLHNPSLPGRTNINGCTIITTTRPWKLHAIKLHTSEIDTALTIQALNDQQKKLAMRVIRTLTTKEPLDKDTLSQKTYHDFHKQIRASFQEEGSDSDSDILPTLMKVPFILTYLVTVWFDRGCFEKTLAANYSTLLELLIQRKVDQERNQLDIRSSKISVLEQTEEVPVLPYCLQSKGIIREYTNLIVKLSNLAFNSLFSDNHSESMLVLSESSVQQVLNTEEINVALKIGILSQSMVNMSILSRKTRLSFLHKTFQEYFAALHLVCSTNAGSIEAKKQYKGHCSSHDALKEMENVLLFVCGMSPSLGSEMLIHVGLVANKYSKTDTRYVYLAQELPRKCMREEQYTNTELKIDFPESDAFHGRSVESMHAVAPESSMLSRKMSEEDQTSISNSKTFVGTIESICLQIGSLHSDIKSVSAAMDVNGQVEFVVISSNPEKSQAEARKKNPPLRTYNITFRRVSSEGKDVMYCKKYDNTSFTEGEIEEIENAINKHSNEIMDKWTNVSAISACPIRSVGYGTNNAQLLTEACIVIYVDVKFSNQRVPLGQDFLPTKLDGVPVDVREGFVTHFGRKMAKEFHQNVRMGCEIGPTSFQVFGTLGAFIDLPNNKTGCITSLHTMFHWDRMSSFLNKNVTDGQCREVVKQPAMSDECLGFVKEVHFFEGNSGSRTGMEIAIIEIDSQRIPVDGELPYCNMEEYGYDEKSPIMYISGQIYDTALISSDKILLNKYGAETLLTEGKFHRKGSIVRPINPTVHPTGYRLWGQIEVKNSDACPFAEPGDSGALVLAPYNGKKHDLRAVGLLGGCTSAGTYYVTPIAAILTQCKLQKLKSFSYATANIHNNAGLAEAMEH